MTHQFLRRLLSLLGQRSGQYSIENVLQRAPIAQLTSISLVFGVNVASSVSLLKGSNNLIPSPLIQNSV